MLSANIIIQSCELSLKMSCLDGCVLNLTLVWSGSNLGEPDLTLFA